MPSLLSTSYSRSAYFIIPNSNIESLICYVIDAKKPGLSIIFYYDDSKNIFIF